MQKSKAGSSAAMKRALRRCRELTGVIGEGGSWGGS